MSSGGSIKFNAHVRIMKLCVYTPWHWPVCEASAGDAPEAARLMDECLDCIPRVGTSVPRSAAGLRV